MTSQSDVFKLLRVLDNPHSSFLFDNETLVAAFQAQRLLEKTIDSLSKNIADTSEQVSSSTMLMWQRRRALARRLFEVVTEDNMILYENVLIHSAYLNTRHGKFVEITAAGCDIHRSAEMIQNVEQLWTVTLCYTDEKVTTRACIGNTYSRVSAVDLALLWIAKSDIPAADDQEWMDPPSKETYLNIEKLRLRNQGVKLTKKQLKSLRSGEDLSKPASAATLPERPYPKVQHVVRGR